MVKLAKKQLGAALMTISVVFILIMTITVTASYKYFTNQTIVTANQVSKAQLSQLAENKAIEEIRNIASGDYNFIRIARNKPLQHEEEVESYQDSSNKVNYTLFIKRVSEIKQADVTESYPTAIYELRVHAFLANGAETEIVQGFCFSPTSKCP